ncbi:MAG: 50S ribosomal protein L35 [Candidatus Aminicenantes bacterium]|nr:50S ribosomal protein L35 [Candidatus Aminicenantes bacterium]
MPKLKTHRGAKKRLSLTANGKIKRKKANHSHILTKKSAKRKRSLRKSAIIVGKDFKKVKYLLPYS